VCGICKCASTVTQQNSDVRLNFPLNLYLLGIFAARHWEQEPADSKVKFVPSTAASSNKKASLSKDMQQNHKVGELNIKSIAYQKLERAVTF
jgi:hypothetical protein